MSDEEFDKLSYKINPSILTGHPVLDKFFQEEFKPYTGSWIHKHPELQKVKETYYRGKYK